MFPVRRTLPAGTAVLLACGLMLGMSGKTCLHRRPDRPPTAPNPAPAGDPKSDDPVRVLPGEVSAVAFAPDGETVATADRQLRLWDLITGQEWSRAACNFDPHQECHFLAFSPDSTRLVSVHRGWSTEWTGGQLMIVLWDVVGRQLRNPRELLARYNRNGTPVYQASFSPDGKTLAAGAGDETIFLWDTATGRKRRRFRGGVAACFSADGRTLTTVTRTGQVRHWNPDTGQRTDSGTETPGGDFMYVACVAFAPRANRLVISDEFALALKDWRTGRTVRRSDLQGRDVCPLAFSPDGKTLAVKAGDGVWLLDGITDATRSWCSNVLMGYRGVGTLSRDGEYLALGEKQILSIRESVPLLARREPVPAATRTEPEGGPLEARLTARQETYTLDLGGLTTEEFRARGWGEHYPPAPRVDLVCVVRNLGGEPIIIPPETKLFRLYLQGDGAINLPPPGQTFTHFNGRDGQPETPGPVTLYPGESYEFPVTNLRSFSADRYWLAPGEYTLYAGCRLTVAPAPKGADISHDGSGWVTVRCAPLRLKVVAPE